MTVVGDKHLLATETLLLAGDEIGEFVVHTKREDRYRRAWLLRVKVRFHCTGRRREAARWEYDRGVLTMVFGVGLLGGVELQKGTTTRRAQWRSIRIQCRPPAVRRPEPSHLPVLHGGDV